MEYLLQLDQDIINFVYQNVQNEFLSPIMIFFTKLGNVGAVWIVITLLLLISKRYRKIGIVCGISLAIIFLSVQVVLKPLIARARPFQDMNFIQLLIKAPKNFSFPSVHSSASFAGAIAIFGMVDKKRFGVAAIILASFIALSRIYLCVHYPTDVVIGILIGIVSGILAKKIYRLIESRLSKKEAYKV